MIRGATTSFKFKLPRNFEEFETITITFWQNENAGPSLVRPLPIVKIKDQCIPNDLGDQCRVKLSAEETLRFSDERKGFVQFHGMTVDGLSYPSKEREFTIYPNYHNNVWKKDVIPSLALDDELVIFDGEDIGSHTSDDVTVLNGRNVEI